MDTKNILEKHKKAKFPSFPDDDDFAVWVEELIELDGYYYGLALSLINGEKKRYDITAFFDLKKRLSNFKTLEDDQNIYQACEQYLDSLEKIVNLIQEQ